MNAPFLLAALVLAIAGTSANAATFVYRKPMPASAVKCATAEACAVRGAAPVTPPPVAEPEPQTPPEPAPTFDPSLVISQARFVLRHVAAGNSMSLYPQAAAAQPGALWQMQPTVALTANRFRVITQTANPTTGATAYSIVAVADDEDETRWAAGDPYLDVTFKFAGAHRFSVTLAVKPEACAAVASAGQSDVTCSGNLLTAVFQRPETLIYFPNSGPFAVFGGYNLQNAAAYQAAENGWKNVGNYPGEHG